MSQAEATAAAVVGASGEEAHTVGEERTRPARRPRDKHLGHNAEVTYNEEDRIGQGQFGTVYKGCLTKDKQVVAVKVFRDVVLAGRTSATSPSSNQGNTTTSTSNERRVLIPSEVDTLWSLRSERCPNILYVHSVWNNHKHSRALGREETVYVIVSEYCAGGDLQHWLLTKGKVSELAARSLMYQLANALLFLKKHNVLHRDIKPANLLLTSRNLEKAVLKVADFGMAKITRPNNNNNNSSTTPTASNASNKSPSQAAGAVNNATTTTTTSSSSSTTPNLEESGMCDTDPGSSNSPHSSSKNNNTTTTTGAPNAHHSLALRSATLFHSELGTPMYMSPERIARRPYGYKADVYSAGMVLYELMTGHVVRATRPSQLLTAVPAAMQQLVQRHSPSLPPWVDLLVRMTEPDPERRLSAEEVVRHAWFTAPSLSLSSNSGLVHAPPLPPLSVELPPAQSTEEGVGGSGEAARVGQPPESRERTATPPRDDVIHKEEEEEATVAEVTQPERHAVSSKVRDETAATAAVTEAPGAAEPEATAPTAATSITTAAAAPPHHDTVPTVPSEEAPLSPPLTAAPMPTWWRVVAIDRPKSQSSPLAHDTSHVSGLVAQLSSSMEDIGATRTLPAACGPHIVTNAIRSYFDCVVHDVLDVEADPVKALVVLGYLFEMMQSAFTLYIQEMEQHGGAEPEANNSLAVPNASSISGSAHTVSPLRVGATRSVMGAVVSRDYGPLQETWQRLKLTFCTLECSYRQRLPRAWLQAALQWRRQASTLTMKDHHNNANAEEGVDAQEQNTTPLSERTNAKPSLSCPLAEAPLLTSTLTLSTLSDPEKAEEDVGTGNEANVVREVGTTPPRKQLLPASQPTMTCARAETMLFARAMHYIEQQALAEVTAAHESNTADASCFTYSATGASPQDTNDADEDDDYGRAIALLRVLLQEVVLTAAEVGLRQVGVTTQEGHEANAEVKDSVMPSATTAAHVAEDSQQLFLLRVPLLCTLSSRDTATVELALKKVIQHKHTIYRTSQAVL